MSVAAIAFGMWALLFTADDSAAISKYDRRTAISDAVAKTRDCIVNIRTLRSVPARLDGVDSSGRIRGLGTGVIISQRGYVLTNYHVVERVEEVKVSLSNQRQYEASIVATDERNDLALLKIRGRDDFKHIELRCDGTAIVGETIIVIGNPYGLENSVSTGIVSHTNRELRLPNGEMARGLLQIDASVNPGNSGGPLLNINGELMGINVAIRTNAQGIAFAIPTDEVRRITNRMLNSGKVGSALDGLSLRTNGDLKSVSHTEGSCPVVDEIDQKSVFSGKLRKGDEIVDVAGQRVSGMFDLRLVLRDRTAENRIPITIRRDRETRVVYIDLNREKESTILPRNPNDELAVQQRIGIETSPVSSERVSAIKPEVHGGLLILSVAEGSIAAKAGLKPNDILLVIHEFEILQAGHIRWLWENQKPLLGTPIQYQVIRDGTLQTGNITITDPIPAG